MNQRLIGSVSPEQALILQLLERVEALEHLSDNARLKEKSRLFRVTRPNCNFLVKVDVWDDAWVCPDQSLMAFFGQVRKRVDWKDLRVTIRMLTHCKDFRMTRRSEIKQMAGKYGVGTNTEIRQIYRLFDNASRTIRRAELLIEGGISAEDVASALEAAWAGIFVENALMSFGPNNELTDASYRVLGENMDTPKHTIVEVVCPRVLREMMDYAGIFRPFNFKSVVFRADGENTIIERNLPTVVPTPDLRRIRDLVSGLEMNGLEGEGLTDPWSWTLWFRGPV